MRCPTLLLIGMLVLPGCGDAPDRASEVTDVPRVDLVETLRIGSLDDPAQSLTRVGGVLPLANGTVWITQPGDAEFRIYGGDGALLTIGGGRGQGPGEFTLPGTMGVWTGDSVWIADQVLGRVSIFDAAGAFGRSFPVAAVELDGYTVGQADAYTLDGAALGIATASGDAAGSLPIVRWDPLSREAERIGSLDRRSTVQVRWQGASVASSAHPMPDAPLIRYDPAGRVIVLERDVAAAPLIRLITLALDGDTLWTREYAYEPQDVPPSEADSIYDARIRSFTEFTRLEGRLSDDDAAAAYRASVTLPTRRPPVRSLHVAGDGRLWLEWSAAPGEPATWWILTPEGDPVASFDLPLDVSVRAAHGDALWAVETDELDVPYVVRYEIRL